MVASFFRMVNVLVTGGKGGLARSIMKHLGRHTVLAPGNAKLPNFFSSMPLDATDKYGRIQGLKARLERQLH